MDWEYMELFMAGSGEPLSQIVPDNYEPHYPKRIYNPNLMARIKAREAQNREGAHSALDTMKAFKKK